jgi:hypothetical protein
VVERQQTEETQFFHLLQLLVAVQAVILIAPTLLQQLADQVVVAQEVLPLQVLLRERLAHQAKVTLVVAVLDMAVQTTLVVAVAVLVQLVVDHLLAPMEAQVEQVLQVALQALL